MIHKDKDAHCYKNEHGQEYISVTTLIARLFPFDRNAIAAKVNNIRGSQYFGMGVERILDQWTRSSGHGNTVHNAVEKYIKEKTMPKKGELTPLVEQFKRLNFKGTLLSEVTVYDDFYRIAGTVDILEDCPDKIYIWDIKTFNKISDDKIKKVSLQLEIYRRLVEATLKKPAVAAGAIVFEDFVVQRKNTKMKVIKALPCIKEVDKILADRLKEIS